MIHPTAVVHPKAEIGADCVIGPYCVIGENVILGHDCRLHSHVVIDGHTCVYVRVPGQADKFARRLVSTVYEHADEVVIREGLADGDEVVVTGGLILQQLYQDLRAL